MRRLILFALIILLGFFCYQCVVHGVSIDFLDFEISKYSKIQDDSEEMTKELAAYNKKNDEDFENTKQRLSVAIDKYNNAKKEYKDLIQTLGIEEDSSEEENIIELTKKAYGIEFLLTTIGDYATKEGIDSLDLQFVKSTSLSAPANSGYVLADLKFVVSGQYTEIAKFLYDLEDDDRLAYEIRDYKMVKNKATFTVYHIPVESASLSEFSTAPVETTGNETNTTNTTNTTGNTATNTGNTANTNQVTNNVANNTVTN